MWNVFKIFVWKKWKNVLFRWKSLLLCFIVPCALIILLLHADKSPEHTIRDIFINLNLNASNDASNDITEQYDESNRRIVYIPNISRYDFMMDVSQKEKRLTEIMGETNNVMQYGTDQQYSVTGLDFENDYNYTNDLVLVFKDTENEKTLNYIIEPNTEVFNLYLNTLSYNYHYYETPILSDSLRVLHDIDTTYIESLIGSKNEKLPNVQIFNCPMTDIFSRYNTNEIMLVVFEFVFLLIVIAPTVSVYQLVEEKQDGIKEILAIATTYSHFNEITHFILGFLVMGGIGIVLMIGTFVYNNYGCHDSLVPVLLMLFFILGLLGYSFFVSTFFDTVTFASIGAFVIYIIPIIFFLSISPESFLMKFKIFSPGSMYIEGNLILESYSSANRCFTWKNFFNSEHPSPNGFNMFEIMLSLLISMFFYIFLYFYISNVFPGNNGTPKPFYFLLMKSYWIQNNEPLSQTPHSFIGSPTITQHYAVKVHNLIKNFRKNPLCGKTFTAVDDISFNLPENRITILLGHNGAGKTTTMQMITGIVAPTKGKIIVDGEDDVAKYRSTIGYCPQNDVFISYMTCLDHLIFFGCLRGLDLNEAKTQAQNILDTVRLTNSANNIASTLSSGMKRRLCLACAVIGQTKLVILDEPSSGLDPESRRDLWDVLLPLRKERTILLTTHSMEEADVLGDKIIIMDHGKIICEGTQFDLKRTYGSGYTLRILMTESFQREETIKKIREIIPKAKIRSELFPTLAISLPYQSLPDFKTVLLYLEETKHILGFDSISMSNTTMEDVFLNSSEEDRENHFVLSQENDFNVDSVFIDQPTPPVVNKLNLILKQVCAIFYKKIIFIRRSWLRFIIHTIIPILACFSCVYLNLPQTSSEKTKIDTFEITARHIKNSNVVLVINQTVPNSEKWIKIFTEIAKDDDTYPIILQNISLYSYLFEKSKSDRFWYYDKLLAAVEIFTTQKTNLSISIYQQLYNRLSGIYTINLVSNLKLKYFYNESFNIQKTIKIKDTDKRSSNSEYNENKKNKNYYILFYILLYPLAFFFYIIFYINLPFIEETTEFHIIQKLNPIVYWFSYWIFDCILHTILTIFYVWVSYIFNVWVSHEYESKIWPGLIVLHCIIGYTYFLILYIIAKSFKKLSSVYSTLCYLLLGSFFASIYFRIENMQNEHPIFFALVRFYPDFNMWFELNRKLQMPDNERFNDNTYLFISVFEMILLFISIVMFYENVYVATAIRETLTRLNPVRRCCRKRGVTSDETTCGTELVEKEDEFVLQEKDDVQLSIINNKFTQYSVVVSQLKKKYVDVPAVKGVSFKVELGQCFGLLGMNGAGKTSIFKMMTLNASITSGKIYLQGTNSRENKSDYQQYFGYCPEMHAHLGFMTSHELLKYMAWIKGTPYSDLNREADRWLKHMDLEKYKSVCSRDYSGGTKRKLNTALAMISNPSVVFLDEPTTGVDPRSRRFMWNCIKDFQRHRNTVILTSHSMDECEELCNRLAIMASGKFKCIGYIPKLKELFGNGFTLLIKVREKCQFEKVAEIKSAIGEMFICQLRDDYAGSLTFNVLENNFTWSSVFSKMQDFTEHYSDEIEDFAINEITLEDIFLKFR